ncbi:MAG: hypothetical protein MPN21_02675 [Thermoanaerobaculia bacterium]|nr:hypothetical protein [Thermoanaerobaculia bacterium]
MIRFLTLLAAILGLAACTPQRAHEEALAENERLRAELEEARAPLAGLESEAPSLGEVILQGTQTRVLESAINGQKYKVKLPRGYGGNDARYPVLYVTDAETNFGGVSYIVQRLIKDGLIPEILVVGVAYDVDYDDFYRLRSRDLGSSST